MSIGTGSLSEVGIDTLSTVERSCAYKEFEEFFHDQFDQYFARSETRQQALQYVLGLLKNPERQSREEDPTSTNNKVSKSAQRLFFGAHWDEEAVHAQLQKFIISEMGHEDGVCLFGATYFPKKGAKTVGVQPQLNRTINREQNCQVCLLIGYTSTKGTVFLDRRLYLPEKWAGNRKRRKEAKIPDNIEYRSKSDLALDMLQSVHSIGVPMNWIVGSDPFSSDRNLRNVIQAAGKNYILSVQNSKSVFQQINQKHDIITFEQDITQVSKSTVYEIVASWNENKWKREIDNRNGDDICVYDWASNRVLEYQNDAISNEVWLLVRRPVSQRCETAYFISNATQDTTLTNLARKTSELSKLDLMIAEACTNFKLADYGVRHWNSWHRHITLSMIAHTWWIYQGKRLI
jgi:SRSO17 transposase